MHYRITFADGSGIELPEGDKPWLYLKNYGIKGARIERIEGWN